MQRASPFLSIFEAFGVSKSVPMLNRVSSTISFADGKVLSFPLTAGRTEASSNKLQGGIDYFRKEFKHENSSIF